MVKSSTDRRTLSFHDESLANARLCCFLRLLQLALGELDVLLRVLVVRVAFEDGFPNLDGVLVTAQPVVRLAQSNTILEATRLLLDGFALVFHCFAILSSVKEDLAETRVNLMV